MTIRSVVQVSVRFKILRGHDVRTPRFKILVQFSLIQNFLWVSVATFLEYYCASVENVLGDFEKIILPAASIVENLPAVSETVSPRAVIKIRLKFAQEVVA